MVDEVAIFIDLENLRYGLLNNHGQEPDISHVVDKAKKYGRPSVMKAYADFTEHPAELRRQLDVSGVDAINVTVTRNTVSKGGKQVERVKNAADMVLALDAVTEALEADKDGKEKVFLLVTGDRDYVKLVTLLRNRFGQRVIIAGVPGSVANDLVTAAGEEDPIEVAATPAVDLHTLKTQIVAMVRRGPAPLEYWTVRVIDQWCQDARQGIPGGALQKRSAIGDLLNEGALERKERSLGQKGTVREAVLNEQRARELGYLE